MDYTRIKNDVNGNPRYAFHFLDFLHPTEQVGSIEEQYHKALQKARKIGGKVYRGKDVGGGIAIQTCNIYKTISDVRQISSQMI